MSTMEVKMNLSAARIFVTDVAEAKSFYADSLGIKITQVDLELGVCIFDAGSAQLIIEAVPKQAPADEQVLVGRFTCLSFAVDDIAAKHQDLLSRGVEFSGRPE